MPDGTWKRLTEEESREIVSQVASGSAQGLEQLYWLIWRFRYYLLRALGPDDVDDQLHQVFVSAVQAIKKGSVRSPERLQGFIRGIIQHSIYAGIEAHTKCRRSCGINEALRVHDSQPSPESSTYGSECRDLRSRLLTGIPSLHRDILSRFYVHEQPREQIQHEMHLTQTQFRILKSIAKANLLRRARAELDRTNCNLISRAHPRLS